MGPQRKWRARARAALEAYFRARSFPRFILVLLVTVAGFIGFFISHTLLHHGVGDMWLRYPIAVLGGYGAFLAGLRLWVEIERARYDPNQVEIPPDFPANRENADPPSKRYTSDSSSWSDWLDLPTSVFDFDEGCLIGCVFIFLFGLLAGAVGLVFSVIVAAPELLAEVFLDAVVVTLLYRHLKTAAREHWLGTAVRRTWRSALVTAAASSLLGLILAGLAPRSNSIGPAMREIFDKPPEKENG